MPSGLFPSPRSSPTGSKIEGIPADLSARHMMSLIAACRGCLPSSNLHDRRWYPYSSTHFPHLHWYLSQIFDPVRRAVAIRSSSEYSCVPRLGTGMAEIQAPDSGRNDASNRALANWSALLSRCSWMDSIRGLSQAFCLKTNSPFGSTSPLPVAFHFSTSADTLNGEFFEYAQKIHEHCF